MVISNNPEGETPTMSSERSKPLHNFSLPSLKWGNQRLLRCFKEESSTTGSPDHRSSASEPEFEKETRRYPPTADGYFKKRDKPKMENTKPSNDGIEQVREKLLIHLKTAVKNVDKMKFPIVPEKDEEEEQQPPVVVVVAPPTAEKPWNLRTRRAACKAPNEPGCGKSLKFDQNQQQQQQQHRQQQQRNSGSPQRNPSPKSLRLRDMAANQGLEKEKEKKKQKKRREFLPVLTSDEIKEDFLFMTGGKPPRRPKKRPRIVQKQIDTLYPCFWLTEVTLDSYKVPDEPETR